MEKFVIIKDSIKHVRRFNVTGRSLEFKLHAVPEGVEPVGWIKDGINQIIQKGTQNLQSGDMVSFSFCSKEFSRGEAWVRFRPADEIKLDDVWNIISNVYQSNSAGFTTELFCLKITTVKLPTGRGRGNKKYNSFDEECSMRKGIVTVKNTDNLCLPRAVVIALAHLTKDIDYKKIIKNTKQLQTLRTMTLLDDSNITIPDAGSGIPELEKFQEYLRDYNIVVYKYGTKGREIIFEGNVESNKRLNLLHHKEHFNVITSLTAAFACSYYCEICRIPYEHKNEHRCGGTCPGCFQSPKCSGEQVKIICDNCKRYFRGNNCYKNHLMKGSWKNKTICEGIRACAECFKTTRSERNHTCGEIFCKICNLHKPSNHLCFIQRDTGTPKEKDFIFIFYDLETRQEEVLESGALLHQTNLCVFKQCCDECLNSETIICKKCGVRLQKLTGADPVGSFTHHLLQLRKKFKEVIVIAHNGQAFDHHFCLRHILSDSDLTPEIIMRGTKILLMHVGNVKFIDSLNYFPMSLAKLPKAFGLGEQFSKGYFPYLFNTKANENYVGALPPIENYSPDTMKEQDRANFVQWYEQHKNNRFEMQRDLIEYCVSDVEILASACLKFRSLLLNIANVCPFTEATTIASACSKVFRRNFLIPDTIGVIPKKGYRMIDVQSKIAIEWLLWEALQTGLTIIHAANGREVVLHGVKVDGYCEANNTVYQFSGCYYHSCPRCFKFGRDEPLLDDPTQTLNLRYEATESKIRRLKEFGFLVVHMWECEFRRLIQDNPEIRTYTNTHPLMILTPLNPRDAFYGGRTGNVWEFYKANENEKIKYVDICSLYPYICKYLKTPIGHPEIIIGDSCKNLNLNNTDGLIKCKVLPPTDLFHPVLPQKTNNKLMFVLCRTCGEEMDQNGSCSHTVEERALTGTWVVDEITKALQKGYEILEIFEIWKYNVKILNKETGEVGLFTAMMNQFIKIKQEASGWPKNCNTEEDKNKYLEEFFAREDVKLEYSRIIENPGLRSLAKLMLCSFWGKFGQRENMPKTKIVNESAELFAMFANPNINVNGILPVNADTLIVSYEHTYESYDPLPNVNAVIAAFVTAQARLKLYSYLELLGDRVLYYDTDSVIYVSRNDGVDVPTSPFIGDMTDELEEHGPGSYITNFVSGGPKNYVYKIHATGSRTGEEVIVCKVKGISLNYRASRLINFNSIKDMVLQKSDPIPIVSKNIRRTKDHMVTTCTETKHYRPNSTKRKFLPDGGSEPYGYKKIPRLLV